MGLSLPFSVAENPAGANNTGRGPSYELKLYYRPVNRKHCPTLDSGLKVDNISDKTVPIEREYINKTLFPQA